MPEVIRIEGLREFQKALRAADANAPKQIRIVLNNAAELIVREARPLVPVRTGKARASLRVGSSQRVAAVKAGGARAPYYPWLDFGGSVGRANATQRPFYRDGRYIYPTLSANRGRITDIMVEGLAKLIAESGL